MVVGGRAYYVASWLATRLKYEYGWMEPEGAEPSAARDRMNLEEARISSSKICNIDSFDSGNLYCMLGPLLHVVYRRKIGQLFMESIGMSERYFYLRSCS